MEEKYCSPLKGRRLTNAESLSIGYQEFNIDEKVFEEVIQPYCKKYDSNKLQNRENYIYLSSKGTYRNFISMRKMVRRALGFLPRH